MAVIVHDLAVAHLDAEAVASWREVPTTIISDELNRAGTLAAAIRPISQAPSFVGEALPVQIMVGDNAALHYALEHVWPGAVLVVDARGHTDTAVWGGILHGAATARGVAAVVIDGSVRDVVELRRSAVPVFARGVVPAGPHKGFGGAIGAPIQCGGCAVAPGDLVRGDEDGVAIVPRARIASLLPRCRARMQRETEIVAGINDGKSTVELLGLPPLDQIG